jgi:hypothetical protein
MDELTSALLKGNGDRPAVSRNTDNDEQNGPEDTEVDERPRDRDIPGTYPPLSLSPRTQNALDQIGAAPRTVDLPADGHSPARQGQEVSNSQNLPAGEIRPQISQATENQSALAPAPTHRPRIDEAHEKEVVDITQNISENIQPEQQANNQQSRETDAERHKQPGSGTLQTRPIQERCGDELIITETKENPEHGSTDGASTGSQRNCTDRYRD